MLWVQTFLIKLQAWQWLDFVATRGRFAVFPFWSRQTFCLSAGNNAPNAGAHVLSPEFVRSLSRS
jgi:hypothetical protein